MYIRLTERARKKSSSSQLSRRLSPVDFDISYSRVPRREVTREVLLPRGAVDEKSRDANERPRVSPVDPLYGFMPAEKNQEDETERKLRPENENGRRRSKNKTRKKKERESRRGHRRATCNLRMQFKMHA